GAGCAVLDIARPQRSWQLVTGGLVLVATALSTALSPWAALAGVPVLGLLLRFLHGERPPRRSVPAPREELASTPEPASNVKLV
ncbi:MAG: hypothetical protein JWO22_3655, partial [Frankiales bacterium]|nr:hypothetical protein [Frankiales bacterium]